MCADEVNLEGPIVEGVLKEQMRLQSLKIFLKE